MTEDSFSSSGRSEDIHEADLDLCRNIAIGSLSSWHQFLSQYSGLIFNVVRRHMFVRDEDDLRTVAVDVLEKLYNGDIAKYRGESALSTWLVVYTRCRVIDYTRKRHGRQRKPKGYDELTDFDKCVLQNYFADRLPISIVIHALHWNGFEANASDIVESVERIQRTLGQHYLNKLEEEWFARKHDMNPSRMLKYMIQMRSEQWARANKNRPDSDLLRKEAEETAEQVRSALSELKPRERKIIDLYFSRSWPARRIAEELGIESQGRVYYIIKKTVDKLRKTLGID
jgi:RNA polymerase sigma factor (sigma-70 family)